MHGHHGWGHFGGGGWGFGWIFPALILGRVISDAFDRPQPQGWPQSAWPPVPPQPRPQSHQTPKGDAWAQPAASQAKTSLACQYCNGELDPAFAYCPHCGKRVAPPACRYCGQTLQPGMAYCAHCGGPAR
jgi:double zinc ribbon protein